MRVERLELRRIALDLVTPFRTSFGEETDRDMLLLKVTTDEGVGWGECVAQTDPAYSPEFVDGAALVITQHLWPALIASAAAAGGSLSAAHVAPALARFKGHPMAKGALEMAVLDAELRATGTSLGNYFGATRDRDPERGQRRHLRQPRRAARTGGRLHRRRLHAHQAQDRARLGHRTGSPRARPDRSRRAAPGRRQHGLQPGRHRAPVPARPVRPVADRAAARRKRICSGTPSWLPPRRRRCASTSRSSRPARPSTRSSSAPPRSSTSSPVASAATSKPAASTICASSCGVPVWCGGHGRDRDRARRQRRARRPPGLHPARRHQRIDPLLPARHRARSDHRRRRPRRTCPSSPASVTSSTTSSSTASRRPPASSRRARRFRGWRPGASQHGPSRWCVSSAGSSSVAPAGRPTCRAPSSGRSQRGSPSTLVTWCPPLSWSIRCGVSRRQPRCEQVCRCTSPRFDVRSTTSG